jgi:biotin carboxyl carrier protein
MTSVKSEISGSVWKIEANIGDKVAEDDPIIILESMKMEIPVLAPQDGVVKEICVKEGDAVNEGDEVAVLE